ncbi:zonular occludens toxin domain-containing protein [Luteimonas sp. SDU82]|uniref:zonular occludens toxin domain-containing protein n=1 Tax=Luteimonas sp. SDU82 TaxID=3422592 RepID=UPI003EC09992
MPIELLTGLPGTSKTTRLVARMIEESQKKNPRPLVAMGVNGLKPGLATILDDPRKWSEVIDRTQGPCTCPLIGGDIDPETGKYPPHTHRIPAGALVFIDEAWKWFGHLQDASRQATPKHVLDLAEHRHMGIDFVWTTQAPQQIYPFARAMVNTHTHIVRKFGTQLCDTYSWGELQEDYKSEGRRAAALKGTSAMPKHAWEWFTSTQENTIKAKIPFRVVALPLLLIGAALAAWTAYVNLRPATATEAAAVGPDSGLPEPAPREDRAAARERTSRPATAAEYAALHLPRFATMPHTAPVFDDREPLSDPLLMCMSGEAGIDAQGEFKEGACTCLSEQGTRYDIGEGECRRVARWGQPYNPYRRTGGQQPQDRRSEPQEARPMARGPVDGVAGEGGAGGRPASYGGMRASSW